MVLAPVLYLLYTSDIPELENKTVATFADENIGEYHEDVARKLQNLNKITDWTQRCAN